MLFCNTYSMVILFALFDSAISNTLHITYSFYKDMHAFYRAVSYTEASHKQELHFLFLPSILFSSETWANNEKLYETHI